LDGSIYFLLVIVREGLDANTDKVQVNVALLDPAHLLE
jgi:hypothetical protein